jgi:glycosyltransferase involved in cell wall biosynthesis
VVTLSRFLQKKGMAWGIDCHFIPNGADPVPPEKIKGDIKLTGRFNLIYTGDKAKWKRTEDICRTMQQLPADIKLYLTGRDENHLRPYASGNCVFLGFLPKGEQYNVMSQADAFVVTADQDCNAKLQEYLRWRKPILAFDGRANLFFKNGRNALLAPNGDYAPLIEQLATDPKLCKEIAANAEHDIPVYSWLEIAQQFEAFFTAVR